MSHNLSIAQPKQPSAPPYATPDPSYAGSLENGFGLWPPSHTPPETLRQNWLKFSNVAMRWFADPDLEALRIVSSAILSHYVLAQKACWIFVMGASSSGKTKLLIDPFSKIPLCTSLSNVTPRSFLTGYGSGQGALLKRPGNASQIWLFKDFTTILTQDWQTRDKILGVLREVWDGSYGDYTGGAIGQQEWEGKVTAIAAGTPKAERNLASGTVMGARFLQVALRPPRTPGALSEAALNQLGYEKQIDTDLKVMATRFIEGARAQWERDKFACPPVSREFNKPIEALVALMTHMRTPVERNQDQSKIIDVGEVESVPRATQTLWSLMVAHARLSGRSAPSSHDLEIAKRVALDTIPSRRRRILSLLPSDSDQPLALTGSDSQMWDGTFRKIVEDLEALGLLYRHTPSIAQDPYQRQWIRWTPLARGLLEAIPGDLTPTAA